MALDTYANLQTSVANWIGRPGDTAITNVLPDMILLFEEEARDRLKTRFNEVTTTLTTVGGQQTLPLPSMWEEGRVLVLQGSPNQELIYVTPEEAAETWVDTGNAAAQDSPIAYTIEGQNFLFYPVPAQAQTISCVYMQGIPALVNGVNWLLTNYPSAYLFGTLAECETFIGNDERLPLFIQRRDAALSRIAQTDIKARYSGGTLQIKTDTGNP